MTQLLSEGFPAQPSCLQTPAELEQVQVQEGKVQKKSKDHIYLTKGAQSAPDLRRKKGGDRERRMRESDRRGEAEGERDKNGKGEQGGEGSMGVRRGAAKLGCTKGLAAPSGITALGQGQSQPCQEACCPVRSLLWWPGDARRDRRYLVAVATTQRKQGAVWPSQEPGSPTAGKTEGPQSKRAGVQGSFPPLLPCCKQGVRQCNSETSPMPSRHPSRHSSTVLAVCSQLGSQLRPRECSTVSQECALYDGIPLHQCLTCSRALDKGLAVRPRVSRARTSPRAEL